jgi:hypothetical protein
MAALSTIALTSLAAATAVGNAVEQRRAAKAAEQQGEYEAMLFGRNASQSEIQAEDALARGRQQEGEVRRSTRLLGGSQRAAFAAQGLDLTTGSPSDVMENDAALGELDALTVRNNARREAMGFRAQAENERLQGDWAYRSGRNAAKSLRRQSTLTLLGGAADAMGTYKRFKT